MSAQIFQEMGEVIGSIGSALKAKFTGVVRFNITNVGTWTLDLKSATPSVQKGDQPKPDLIILVSEEVFTRLYEGKENAQQAFMKGRLKIKGSTPLAMKFNTVLTATRKELEKTKGKKRPVGGAAPSAAGEAGSNKAPKATTVFQEMAGILPSKGAKLVKKMNGIINFDIHGEKWALDLKHGSGSISREVGQADLTVTIDDNTFFDVSQGKISAQQAFMKGLIKLKGSMALAQKLGPVLQSARPNSKL